MANLGDALKDFFWNPKTLLGSLGPENMVPGALRSSPDVKKHAGPASEAPGARFGIFGGFPGQIRPCTENTKTFTGCSGSHRLMVPASGGPGDFVLKHFDEFYNLEWVPGPENHEKPSKIMKNQNFS